MSKTFFGFALADGMFQGDCVIKRVTLTADQAKAEIEAGAISCCNPSHVATIEAAKARFGIAPSIPETPPRVNVQSGDSVIVMGVRGLPRMTDRHEYTADEIAQATFAFSKYTVE